jgi:two-component system sensor histidine kinase MtrB
VLIVRSWRSGVRTRVQVAFALGGLLVSVFIATVSWNLTTTYLYNQREITTTRETLLSVDLLRRSGATPGLPSVERLRNALAPGGQAVFLASDGSGGMSTSASVRPTELPSSLAQLAREGTPTQQRVELDGEVLQAVAVAVPELDGVYVGLFRLRGLEEGLRILSTVLAATAALATLLSAAVGRWAAHRTLHPLRVVAGAAAAVASGNLQTRVEARGDPDLEPLAGAFNKTITELRERIARDARFASDVSHELRSPVTTIANAAELLTNRRHELSPSGQAALDLLCAETDRFRALVTDLLEVSREEQLSEVDLQPVVLDALVVRAADGEAGRPVTRVDPDAAGVLVVADPRRLQQVVCNLVANARLHGGHVHEVVVSRTADFVRISVLDDGPGVPPEWRERVFERFSRASAARASTSGSGLGLAIVAQHVARHGGQVWVEDGAPHGARFVVELPILQEAR